MRLRFSACGTLRSPKFLHTLAMFRRLKFLFQVQSCYFIRLLKFSALPLLIYPAPPFPSVIFFSPSLALSAAELPLLLLRLLPQADSEGFRSPSTTTVQLLRGLLALSRPNGALYYRSSLASRYIRAG